MFDINKLFLVVVNPHSGKGRGLHKFHKHLEKKLDNAEARWEIHQTKAEPSTLEFFRHMPLDELNRYHAILVVSGDGTIHQLLNGLMSRPDADEAMKKPLCFFPVGSGNGLAHSLLRLSPLPHDASEGRFARHYTFADMMTQDERTQCDLVRVSYGGHTTIWSFLSVAWGLVADIDIESENKLRFLGAKRFHYYCLYKALFDSKCYRGRLVYRVAPSREAENSEMGESSTSSNLASSSAAKLARNSNLMSHDGEFACILATYLPHISKTALISPKSTLSDQLIYLTYITQRLKFSQLLRLLEAIPKGQHDKLPFVTVVPVTKFHFQPMEDSRVVVDGEVIPYTLSDGPIEVEVSDKKMQILWRQKPDSRFTLA